jgi:hypothetical protein
MKKIAHIINPVSNGSLSGLVAAQTVTFQTMETARKFSRESIDVELYTAQYPEDAGFIPDNFTKTRDLDRSVLDMMGFKEQRKLPLLVDILDRLNEASKADYFIYTNADIALMPTFYATISSIIDGGCDSFVINRRTINPARSDPGYIPLMYAEIGEPHIGHDCFILPRSAYSRYIITDVCIGMPKVGKVLLWNLAAYGNQFREFADLHLTFHIGADKSWKDPAYEDYRAHNDREALRALALLNDGTGLLATLKRDHPRFLDGFDPALLDKIGQSRV